MRFGYDENFWVRSLTLRNPGLTANLSTTTYTYDNDGLLTQASFDGQALNLTRSADNGLLQGTSFNRISDTWGYNPFAEPTSYVARFDGAPVFSAAFVRDNLGRITRKTEMVAGVSTVVDYTYDLAGRLDTVSVNGTTNADYDYDDNSNRTQATYRSESGTLTVTGSYDAQDRMTAYAGASYQYGANGELTQRDLGAAQTRYQTDALGNLREVRLPSGQVLTYQADGYNRRVGKSVNGTLVQQFVYLNALEPVAELDANSNLVAVFAYADKAHGNRPPVSSF